MSKASKGQSSTLGGGRKRVNEAKEEPPIFCEKCLFVFQGDMEFKGHGCQKNAEKNEPRNKRPMISLEKKKGKQVVEKVLYIFFRNLFRQI